MEGVERDLILILGFRVSVHGCLGVLRALEVGVEEECKSIEARPLPLRDAGVGMGLR
jgi:hypothetical protein